MAAHASDPRTETILALEKRRQTALIAEDFAALDALLADDLIHIHAGGNADTKPQYFKLVETLCGFVAIDRPTPDVRFLGNVAIVTGPMTHTVKIKPTGQFRTMEAFGTQVWAPHGDTWRLALYQASEIAAH